MNTPKNGSYNAFIANTLITVALFAMLSGCASTTSQGESKAANANITVCKDPRPQMCTRDYRPVCATLKDGSHKTYSNGCTSCADQNVVSYVDKKCPGDK